MRTALPLPLKPIALGLAAGTLIAAVGAVRAEEQAQSGKAPAFRSVDADRGSAQPQPVDLARLYADGMSARELIDAPVRGENGERIGDVKDIVVNEHGNIARLIVEVGGFFELADQHIGVPWEDLAFGEDMQFVQVPLKEVESGTYALGGRVPQGEDVPVALTSWRVNELIGDYAAIEGAPRHGMVTDVIFNSRGQLQAVLVDRLGQRGLWAYPYAGYRPGAYAHFTETVIALEPFDYAELGRKSRYAGTDATATAGS